METITPLETDPGKLSDIQAFNEGQDIVLSEECTELVDLLTDPEFENTSVSVKMGRIAMRPYNNKPIKAAHELLYPAGYKEIVDCDAENPDGIYEVRQSNA